MRRVLIVLLRIVGLASLISSLAYATSTTISTHPITPSEIPSIIFLWCIPFTILWLWPVLIRAALHWSMAGLKSKRPLICQMCGDPLDRDEYVIHESHGSALYLCHRCGLKYMDLPEVDEDDFPEEVL